MFARVVVVCEPVKVSFTVGPDVAGARRVERRGDA